MQHRLERSLLRLECGQQNSGDGAGPALWGRTGSAGGVGYWIGLGLAHSRKHNKIIALQQSECGAAQPEAGKGRRMELIRKNRWKNRVPSKLA